MDTLTHKTRRTADNAAAVKKGSLGEVTTKRPRRDTGETTRFKGIEFNGNIWRASFDPASLRESLPTDGPKLRTVGLIEEVPVVVVEVEAREWAVTVLENECRKYAPWKHFLGRRIMDGFTHRRAPQLADMVIKFGPISGFKRSQLVFSLPLHMWQDLQHQAEALGVPVEKVLRSRIAQLAGEIVSFRHAHPDDLVDQTGKVGAE